MRLTPNGTKPAAPLLVDLDGVLRLWDPAVVADVEIRHSLPPGSIAGAAFAPDVLGPAVTGALSDQQWRAEVARRLEAVYGPGARCAVAEWSLGHGSVDDRVLAILRAQRRVRPVALLTNATTRLNADLGRLGLDSEIDAVFSSAAIGRAKPDRRVFEYACRALVRPAPECLFVDDTAENVAAAREFGLRAHQFTSPEALEKFLERCSSPTGTR